MTAARAVLGRLGRRLREAGYTEAALQQRLQTRTLVASPATAAVQRRRVEGDDECALLVRLFLLGEPLVRRKAVAALRPVRIDELKRAGVLELDGELVRATLAIQAWRDLLVFYDWKLRRTRPDRVFEIAAASEAVAALAVRVPAERSLDVGTGNGVQALLLARHASDVVATDTNQRALDQARLTLALNEVGNVELRQGNLFAPVAGEEFDQIVSNPPFIVSPDRRVLVRDGGGLETTIVREVIDGSARALREGGFSQLLCDWPLRRGEAWSEVAGSWLDGSGCDGWAIRFSEDDALSYAARWVRPFVAGKSFERTLDRWRAAFSRAGIERIANGAVALRRRSGDNWFRADVCERLPSGAGAGEQILRGFRGHDWLGRRELEEATVVPAPGLRLDETSALGPNGTSFVAAELRLRDGLAIRTGLKPPAVALLRRLDGRPLREALAGMGETAADEVLGSARELVRLGLLIPKALR